MFGFILLFGYFTGLIWNIVWLITYITYNYKLHRPIDLSKTAVIKNDKTSNDLPNISDYEEKRKLKDIHDKSNELFNNIPSQTLELLWIGDGKYKNYNIPINHSNIIYSNNIEPSCIFTKLSIETEYNYNLSTIENLDYYPTYCNLSPLQRFYYLKWLENTNQLIPIGYVFIYYYGLERHLIYGNFEKAFNEIINLKQNFKNRSFQDYSTDALLISCILRNKIEYFQQILNYIDSSKIVCSIKAYINEPLAPDELIKIKSLVGFTNNYYIKKDYATFKNVLSQILIEEYGKPFFPIDKSVINQTQSYITLAMANTSFEKRTAKLKNIFSNNNFCCDVKNLLLKTHMRIKNNKSI